MPVALIVNPGEPGKVVERSVKAASAKAGGRDVTVASAERIGLPDRRGEVTVEPGKILFAGRNGGLASAGNLCGAAPPPKARGSWCLDGAMTCREPAYFARCSRLREDPEARRDKCFRRRSVKG
jgi:hypothetical protein